ncbi:hypothetical protein BDZ89DRAFT_1073250 [Hymenopellis radicata]|nr:hypothetical protein BDZ89DRAFT_1073250 [Hymenopellis radicata]
MTLNSELSWPVQKAIREYVSAKHANHQYAPSHTVIPQDPHPLLRAALYGPGSNTPTSMPPDDDIEYPGILPGKPFSWSEIQHYPRTSLLPTDVALYKSNPELLSELTFTASGDMGDEAFRVSCFLTTLGKDSEKIFYLVHADEGADAFGYSSRHFF